MTMLRMISSMATRALLAELFDRYASANGLTIQSEAVGGVDAARRVQAGEAFDGVLLAAKAIDELVAAGRCLGPRTDLVASGVAVAVREGAPRPDIGSEASVKAAVLASKTLGYSTGPSGTALVKQFERWGIADQVAPKIVQAPPGVPVGSLVADGRVELGFQQLSELMSLPGITVLGPLPPAIQITTIFSAGVAATSTQPEAVRALFAWLAGPETAEAKRRHGMAPA